MPYRAEDLNNALRDLIDMVRTADLEGVELDDHVRSIEALVAALRPHRHEGMRMQAALRYEDVTGDASEGGGMSDPNQFFPYSPVVGRLNPIAPPVEMWLVDGAASREVHGSATIGAAYNGPPDCVHGGVIAEILDELLGCVCVTNGLGGFTGTLNVVYRSTTPLSQPLTLRGWHDRSEGRKVFAKGTIHHGDTLCVEAEGIFIRSAALPGGGASR
ncbi:MAG: PaaI family thioesterase [Acidimicrobiales bacterium]